MELKDIELGDLKPDPDNERGEITEASVKDLAATIKAVGLLQPLVVRWAGDDGYFVVAGHRRLVALQTLKKAKVTEADNGKPLFPVPCIERDNDATDTVAARLIENLQREDIHPVDEARGLFRLVGLGVKQKDMVKLLGRSAAHVKDRLLLLELPDEAQQRVNSGTLAIKDGLALLALQKLGSQEKFEKAVKQVVGRASAGGVAASVKDQLEVHDKDQAKVQWRAKAKAAGVKVTFGDAYATLKDGGQLLTPKYDTDASIDADKHESEPCHAWLVVPEHWGGKVSICKPYCTEPARHAKGGESKVKWKLSKKAKDEQAAAEERLQRKAQEDADRAVGFERLQQLAQKPPAKAVVLDRVLEVVLGTLDQEDAYEVALLLGLDVANSARYSNVASREIRGYLAGGQKAALQVAFAWALHAGRGGYDDDVKAQHFAFLVDQGVELTETQHNWIAGYEQRRQQEAEAAARREVEAAAKAAKVAELIDKGKKALKDRTEIGKWDECLAILDELDGDEARLAMVRQWLADAGDTTTVADPAAMERLGAVRRVLVEEKLSDAQLAAFDALAVKVTTLGQAQFLVESVDEWLSDRPPVDDEDWQPVDEGEWSAIADVLAQVVAVDNGMHDAMEAAGVTKDDLDAEDDEAAEAA